MENLYPLSPILVVDDEPNILKAVRTTLEIAGFTNIVTASESGGIPELVARQSFSTITLDLSMPELPGQKLITEILTRKPETRIVVVSGHYELDTVVECMRLGAYDYLTKPVDNTRLVTCVKRAVEMWEADTEIGLMKSKLLGGELTSPEVFAPIRTKNDRMFGLFKYAEAVSRTSLPVLITGETGTGKELLARAVHRLSGCAGELVTVNLGGLDDTMFSDTLFGHVKGAYTGAQTQRDGMIKRADTGTLFLDEIGDLSMESQVKMLRLLQEREYIPLGADRPKKTHARFVCATNVDLEAAVKNESFRADLYYRLKPHQLHMLPLRERLDDIEILTGHFLQKTSEELGQKPPRIPVELYSLLMSYSFPGNIRELEGMITDSVIRNRKGGFSLSHIREYLSSRGVVASAEVQGGQEPLGLYQDLRNLPTLRVAANSLVDEAMARAQGNQSAAAQLLGITRTALNKRLSRRREEGAGEGAGE